VPAAAAMICLCMTLESSSMHRQSGIRNKVRLTAFMEVMVNNLLIVRLPASVTPPTIKM